MKLAFLHPHFTIAGGGSRVVLEMASRLGQRGHEVAVVSQRQDPRLLEGFGSVEFCEIPGELPNHLRHYFQEPVIFGRIARTIADLKPDVIVSNVAPSEYWGAFLRLLHDKTRVVWYCHDITVLSSESRMFDDLSPMLQLLTGSATRNPLFRAFSRRLINHLDGFIANSEHTAANLRRLYGRSATVIYPGVDPVIYKPSERVEPYLLCVGQLTKSKNFELALEAVSVCREIFHAGGIRLLIVGNGPNRGKLLARAEMAGVTDLVIFAGEKDYAEMPQLYAGALVTLQPSIQEGFGLVPIESMSCGTPVIAGLGGVAGETLIEGVTGLLVRPTKEDFANAIEKLVSDRDLAQRMGTDARLYVTRNFAWNHSIDRMESLLERICSDDT